MSVVRLTPDRVFYRFHSPKWAGHPISGAGAAINGGRFNRRGVEALYLAGDVQTAFAEFKQDIAIPPPGTLVAYQLTLDRVYDLSDGFRPDRHPPAFADHACAWQAIHRLERRDPPSWTIGDLLVRAGWRGLLFPSTRQAARINLVVFPANLTSDDQIQPHDPNASLPRDQSSWPPAP